MSELDIQIYTKLSEYFPLFFPKLKDRNKEIDFYNRSLIDRCKEDFAGYYRAQSNSLEYGDNIGLSILIKHYKNLTEK